MGCGTGKGCISIPSDTLYSRTIIVVKSEISSQPIAALFTKPLWKSFVHNAKQNLDARVHDSNDEKQSIRIGTGGASE